MSPLTLARHRHRALVGSLSDQATPLGRSDHFSVWGLGAGIAHDEGDIVVVHEFLPEEIDNNIGGYVADELLPLLARSKLRLRPVPDGYAWSEQETFERYVGAIVRSIDGNERRAWHRFYDNTLAALRGPAIPATEAGIADFNACARALYRRVESLSEEVGPDRILDVATCFGFLPLFLAHGDGQGGARPGGACEIVGCDLNSALVALADDYRRTRGIRNLSFVRADILAPDARRALSPDDRGFDVVTAIHLLEHLEPAEAEQAFDNLWALTTGRLIVAVPFEAAPDPRFGHRQVFDFERLEGLGRATGGRCRYFEHHGGWLVADRTPINGKSREDQG